MAYENNTGLPSVTQIMKPWVDTSWFTKESAHRGDQVHERIKAHLSFDFMFDFDEKYAQYFNSFLDFEPRIKNVILFEERLADEELGFCGQPDIVFEDAEDSYITLGDWKTAQQTYKYWPFQLAGYVILLERLKNIKVQKIMTIRLRDIVGRKPLINVYSLPEYKRLFLNQLEIYKKFNN